MAETLSGIIERITFHNADTGFAVLRVQATGRRGLVTVVGHLPSVVAGEYVEASGVWTQDRDHGLQFNAEHLRTTPPHTLAGIEKYLGSGLIKGIGPQFAHKIVEVFGERTLTVIDESPAFLQEVKGIGPRRIQLIRESWSEQKAVRSIMVFLQSHGVGTARAVRIYKQYGDQAIDLVRANPYRLATDIWGVGFKHADQLADKLGIDRSSPLRARAALRYVLQQLSNQGHCGFPEGSVVDQTAELTGIAHDVVHLAVEQERSEGDLVREVQSTSAGEETWLFLKPLFLAEVGVARAIRTLREGPHPLPALDMPAALRWVEKKMALELAATQRDAIRQAATQKVLVITGGPGVGKTTLVSGILEVFAARGLRCALCAPTGRAAKRLGETTGREARTIHRLLEFDPALGDFKRDRGNHLDLDLLIVDEVSMVDVVLMNQLLRAVPPWACLVLVGDVDQLPSVGPGTVLADVIASRAVPVVRLTEIFRQAGQSRIVRAAHLVNHGEIPESDSQDRLGDFYIVEVGSPETIVNRMITLIRERIPARFGLDPLKDVQVLTPMNRSELGARNLNSRLQEVLNPSHLLTPGPLPQRGRGDKRGFSSSPMGERTGGKGAEVERFGWRFRLGDKVLQTVNDYQKEVFNGDIGRVSKIDTFEQEMTVAYETKEVVYSFGELDELALAYALTVHKSQGSEYPAVVIPLHSQHYLMLQRNLLYTGITRGKKLVVLVGTRKALATAVQRQDTSRRYTALCRRLQDKKVM
jgi:exodeoxyribonuclease V alpha subunit